ncbi:hypothetical protein BD310DRAFT_943492 [Dichomitus squalens]|uniref:Wax synthase domain-containing protein n=1 Tax=Dichomitus squalens TaxID=114155 RepID=A0A4Q9QFD8_9APHY|nr:hypothetical protein BD310DRAFT_943492 [Dichomitus squalens]
MAYLVRRRDTRLMRVLLLPTVIAMTVRCTFRYQWKDIRFKWFEWDRGLVGLVVIAKSIDFALVREGRFKVGEKELPAISDPEQNTTQRRRTTPGKEEPLADREDCGIVGNFLPRALYDALEVGLAMRGVGWDFGQSLYIPSGERPSERDAFIRATLWRFARNMLYIDIWETIEKLTPGVSSTGGTIFLSQLPFFQRYACSTFLHLGHGLFIAAGVSCVYDIFSLIGALFCGSKPDDWPPIAGDVWAAQSLHEFWSKGWHQSLRYIFLTYGGFPGQWLAGNVGMVFGTFLASALFHEIGIATTGVAMDRRVFVFFLLQAVGITMERGFGMLTGRRVSGILGFAWAVLFVLGFGQMCTDSWFNRGIAGALAVPESLSIGRQIILPTLRGLAHLYTPVS